MSRTRTSTAEGRGATTGEGSAAAATGGPDAGRLDTDADVVVVGHGPVGMVMALRLAMLGHRVITLERYSGLYNLPRAAIFDDETMRTFDQLGIAETMLPLIKPQPSYEWRNGAGELLIEVEYAATGRSGWAEWYMMFQPELEDVLDRRCRESGVDVRYDSPVAGYEQHADHVVVTLADGSSVTARYVVACDGGNSFTRRHLGIEQTDHGFQEPWMVCDFRLLREVDVPDAMQVCDPVQPQSIISLGPTHHRSSFMLDSEESFAEESRPERVWERVADLFTPDDAELIRVATYTFRSRIAESWRDGRILLAGDAPHQMPPFLGQGMCSGVRDAQNLSFKLDLILRGLAEDALLDTYQTEREPHVTVVVLKGKELGQVQTMRDPELAAVRDAELLARRRASLAPEKVVFPGLGPGAVRRDDPAEGRLVVQGRVAEADGEPALFDRVVGYGPTLLVDGRSIADDDVPRLDPDGRLTPRAVVIGGADGLVDVDGTYAAYFDQIDSVAVLVRPDFYVFGSAASGADIDELVEDYARTLAGAALPA